MSENYSEYDSMMDELQAETRIGDHDFMVSDVTTGVWADLTPKGSQDPYVKVTGVLLTAQQAKCDFTWSPPPPPAIMRAEMASWEGGKRKAIAQSISIAKKIVEYYGKGVADLKAGDVIRVKTVKTKVNVGTGKGGFIKIAAILPKDQIGKASIDKADELGSIPF